MSKKISESRFYMWRTLFAMAHADNIITQEELRFMSQVLEDIKFSEEQTNILKDDIVNAKNIEEMFTGIKDTQDRVAFFNFARDLVWSDGEFCEDEQNAIMRLRRAHYKITNVDDLVGKTGLEFEDQQDMLQRATKETESPKKWGLRNAVFSFRSRFLDKLDD